MSLAPIALFAYNRLLHIKKTIKALQKNNAAVISDLFVYSDAAKTEDEIFHVNAVREFLKTIDGFRSVTIIERKKNFGLGKNIIEGVNEVIEKFGKIIVLEDDLITSPYFLDYMNNALHLYEREEKVISIHGYVYPVNAQLPETFFIRGADCLGWATWKRGWDLFQPDGKILLQQLVKSGESHVFDYMGAYPYLQMLRDQVDGRNNSWAVRWYASAFVNEKYTLYPGRSLVYHTGGDGSGTNTGFDRMLDVELTTTPIKVDKKKIEQDEKGYTAFRDFHKRLHKPDLVYRIKRKINKLLNK